MRDPLHQGTWITVQLLEFVVVLQVGVQTRQLDQGGLAILRIVGQNLDHFTGSYGHVGVGGYKLRGRGPAARFDSGVFHDVGVGLILLPGVAGEDWGLAEV